MANFQVNSDNELMINTNGGSITVMGTTTSTNSGVTVNGTSASTYGDATFAAAGLGLTNSYTAVASDNYGRSATNTVAVNLATNVTFQYDANGNLTNDGLRNFAYDDENQLIQVWVTTNWMSQFSYDGKMRRRIRQEYTWAGGGWVETNTVCYIYDGNVVIQERDINNLPTTTYTRGLDLSGNLEGAGSPRQSVATAGGIGGLLARTAQSYVDAPLSGHAFYHADGNGNITMLINSSQAIVAKYLYDAFGNPLSASGLLAEANRYWSSSKERHLNSGLVYYLYRYYDPNLQRGINRDPIGESGGINLYGFVGNNPINRIDPLGLAWYDGIAGLAGLGGPGTASASWGGFGSSWSDSANSIGQGLAGSLSGNPDQVANAYDTGVFGQTQDADSRQDLTQDRGRHGTNSLYDQLAVQGGKLCQSHEGWFRQAARSQISRRNGKLPGSQFGRNLRGDRHHQHIIAQSIQGIGRYDQGRAAAWCCSNR